MNKVQNWYLTRGGFSSRWPNGKVENHPCAEFISVGWPRVTDASLNGTMGKVIVSTPVTYQKAFPPMEYINLPAQCGLGEGQAVGQMLNVTKELNVEKWQSGWKLVEGQLR